MQPPNDKIHSKSNSLASSYRACKHWYRFIVFHYPEWGRLIHFLGVGALGFICNLFVLTILLWIGIDVKIALMSGIICSTLINFIGDRILVFAYARHGKLVTQFIGFILVCFCGAAINYRISLALLCRFEWLIPQIALIGGILVATVFNYLCLRYLVFKKHSSFLS